MFHKGFLEIDDEGFLVRRNIRSLEIDDEGFLVRRNIRSLEIDDIEGFLGTRKKRSLKINDELDCLKFKKKKTTENQKSTKNDSTIVHSNCDLYLVSNLVRWYLPATALTRFKLVDKEWNTSCTKILSTLHLPIAFDGVFRVCKAKANREARTFTSRQQWANTFEEQKLPPLDFLAKWNIRTGAHNYRCEASSNGLLLLSYRNDYQLVLCNPLARQSIKVPKEFTRGHEYLKPFTNMFLLHLIVDDSTKEYKILRITDQYVNIFNSNTNSWRTSVMDPRYTSPGLVSSACANGRVYVCSSATWNNPTTPNHTRLNLKLEVLDIEPDEWQHNDLTLDLPEAKICDFHSDDLKQLISYPWIGSCRGDLYVVASTWHCKCSSLVKFSHTRMELRFHIYKLRRKGNQILEALEHVVTVPADCEFKIKKDHKYCRDYLCKYSCTVRGNFICLAVGYIQLLQYDVLSGVITRYKYTDHLYSGRISQKLAVLKNITGLNMTYTPRSDFNLLRN